MVLGRPRIYQDEVSRQREKTRRYRKNKKPYYVKRAVMRQRLEDVASQTQKALDGLYDVVVIDPPWPVAFQAREARPNQVALAYATMTVAEIQALPLPLAEHAHVWLWTTQRFLPDAFRCLDAWGLTYSCCFVWMKPGGIQPLGLPQMNGEFALYARKGQPLFLETTALPTHFAAPRGTHSAKPAEFYATVRRVTGGRRLDMFARACFPGFDAWGQEAPAPAVDAEAAD
jgi:N6-adenosine-specific RNA methylase IME4